MAGKSGAVRAGSASCCLVPLSLYTVQHPSQDKVPPLEAGAPKTFISHGSLVPQVSNTRSLEGKTLFVYVLVRGERAYQPAVSIQHAFVHMPCSWTVWELTIPRGWKQTGQVVV